MAEPQLQLTPDRVMCARHGEPLRPEWPRGYPQYVTLATQALMCDRAFVDKVAEIVGGPPNGQSEDTIEVIHQLLDAAPVCCRLPRDTLLEVYRQVAEHSGLWARRECALCGRTRAGSEYRKVVADIRGTRPQGPITAPWPHVCLRCVTHGQDGH